MIPPTIAALANPTTCENFSPESCTFAIWTSYLFMLRLIRLFFLPSRIKRHAAIALQMPHAV